jgi:hypothetical protein
VPVVFAISFALSFALSLVSRRAMGKRVLWSR